MSSTGGPQNIPPFPPEYRAAGLLLHVTSLPSPYGIGDLGPSAFSWVDRLHEAGQRWWQALPLGPTGYGNSPYQSLSSFAGNVLLISRLFHLSRDCSKRRGGTLKPGSAKICDLLMKSSAPSTQVGWKTMFYSVR
jgi:4-alpha-glucanotransferase